ncbi:MAG: ketoacyl-ACP synthase III [Solibacillus sp.]|jgi:3-oxoacyl-[acyl-carrier-protein] synthase III|uniref:3-oxoacyl-ACP synthase III family protein n=1 Tax=unclassified Solibacillus TaxID=2637870 RepID=UPI0030FCE73E
MTTIMAIEYHFPTNQIFNDPNNKLTKKVGISSKYIAEKNETASDLALQAAEKLFAKGVCKKSEIDFLLFCTQAPDYILPTTACIIQEKLKLPTSCGALDFNLGCSGFVYGLSLAKGLIESGQAKNVLLLTADTYSKFIHENDFSTSLLFGDAAAATLITESTDRNNLGPFIFGTDGSGAKELIIFAGGSREPVDSEALLEFEDEKGNIRTRSSLYMNGSEVFNFAMREVPKAINDLLTKENTTLNDYDYFIFHQANKYMLDALRRRMDIDKEKFSIQLHDCGNTVSSTIPIALKREIELGHIKNGDKVLLVGFGVGLSWGVCSIKIRY